MYSTPICITEGNKDSNKVEESSGKSNVNIEENNKDHSKELPEGSKDTHFSDDFIDDESDNGKGVGHTHHIDSDEEVEGIDYNIMHVTQTVDLSSSHTDSLQAKKERKTIPLQVRTKKS